MTCPHCGQELTPIEGQRFCAFCGGALKPAESDPTHPHAEQGKPDLGSTFPAESDRAPGESGAPRQGAEGEWDEAPQWPRQERLEYCPWEDQEHLGFFKGIWETIKQTLITPEVFFSRLPARGGLLNPLMYALIVTTTGSLLSFVWAFSFKNPLLYKLDLSGNMALLAGLSVPLIVFLSVVVWALLVHVSLFLTGAANRDFEATFRVVCYSSGPELLNVIPVLGAWIGLAWKICIMVIGLREVHQISLVRSALAIFLPAIVCCGISIAAVGFIAAMVGPT